LPGAPARSNLQHAEVRRSRARFHRGVLVGDPKGEILSTYDVRVPVLGLARRVTFVIGKDRRIEGVHESAFDPLSHVARACKLVLKRADGAPSP